MRLFNGVIAGVAFVALGYLTTLAWERSHAWQGDRIYSSVQHPSPNFKSALPPPAEGVPAKSESEISFEALPLDFVYDNGSAGEFHLAETLGGGVAAFDYDNNEVLDLAFIDGGNPVSTQSENRLLLLRRVGTDQWTEVGAPCNLQWTSYGHGVAVGDINNDGFPDLFVTGYTDARLFLNNGDGTFQPSDAITPPAERWMATAAFGDLDRDGDLDLYVTAYADTPKTLPTLVCESAGVRIHCHPHHYRPQPDVIYENLGDGRFADRSESSGIAAYREFGLGVIIADLDNREGPEIFVANDGLRNLLFRRTAGFQFEEIALPAGVAYSSEGQGMGSMGIACEDLNGDTLPEILTTNFMRERNVLYDNLGELAFIDRSAGTALDFPSRPMVGWGTVAADWNEDGEVDLFIANGHVSDFQTESSPFAQPAFLFQNDGGHFRNVSEAVGEYFDDVWHGRGVAAGDFDGDQRPDLVVSHIGQKATLLLNRSQTSGNRMIFRLVGRISNREAANARIIARVGQRNISRQIILSQGYLSSSSTTVHLGLGDANFADEVVIHWPAGHSQSLGRVRACEKLLFVEPLP